MGVLGGTECTNQGGGGNWECERSHRATQPGTGTLENGAGTQIAVGPEQFGRS